MYLFSQIIWRATLLIYFCNNNNIIRTYEKNIATYQCKLIGLYIKHLNFFFRNYRIGFTFEIQRTVNLYYAPRRLIYLKHIWGGLIEMGRGGGAYLI